METFYANSSQFTLDMENDETTSDHLSIKMNRSRMLLSEFGTDTTNRSSMQVTSSYQETAQFQKASKPLPQSLLKRTFLSAEQPQPSLCFYYKNFKQFK